MRIVGRTDCALHIVGLAVHKAVEEQMDTAGESLV